MPDRDILGRGVQARWRSSYKLAAGGAPPGDVVHSALAASAATLRVSGGLPELGALARVVSEVAIGLTESPEAFRELRAIERAAGDSRNARIAVRSAMRMIATLPGNALAPEDLRQGLADAFCEDLVEHHLFARIDPDGMDAFDSDAEATSYLEECRAELQPWLHKLAARLVSNPQAENLRAPRMSLRSKPATADMLHEVVTL